ncbi:MFS transporter [Arthrobacter sp. M4]|uniref:MFS transporter n=1 Tax=Arthrobacter sp. M4 TaxID=218160 RepID=UPI001CDBEFE2|nr:MFS transporter [Arthrobacter sp. M4]MCA4132067.1 MFS transporter [Arthrobacter sp. M4]
MTTPSIAATSQGSPRRRPPLPRDVVVMLIAAFLIALGFGLVAPVLPQFAVTFDVGATAAAVIVSIFALVRLAFAPAGGFLVSKFGERRVYVTGLLIVAASTAACAFAQDYWQLLVFRGVGGAGSVMFTVAAMGLLIRLSPPESRGRVSGAYASAFLLGSVGGPVIGGLLAGLGLRIPFLAYAGALILAALVVATQLHRAGPVYDHKAAQQDPMLLLPALGDSAYRAALASSFANGWAAFGVRMATVPLFAVAVLGAGPDSAGWAMASFAVGNAVALLFSGRLADTWGRKPLVLAGLTVAGLATAILGVVPTLALLFAASAVAGFGAGLLGPAQQAAVADVIGRDRSGGRVVAAFQMVADAGAIVGPVLAGVVADGLGYGWAFGATGLVMLLAAAMWLGARETATKN